MARLGEGLAGSVVAFVAHGVSEPVLPEAFCEPDVCQSRQARAQRATAMPASFVPDPASPNIKKAADSGISSESRCDASLTTIPARCTAPAIATKTLGSSTPSKINTHQGVSGANNCSG